MINAVLFDLDDTLYLQEEWLTGAFDAVASEAERAAGVDPGPLRVALASIAAEGSDKGHIIDRALTQCGYDGGLVTRLVPAFLEHAPTELKPFPGVLKALARLREQVPIGLVSDGEPGAQKAKLSALVLSDAFDVVVLSDELGRSHRKPDPAPLLEAAKAIGADPGAIVYVGDRPDKDVEGARRAGMRAVRVRTGEHAWMADEPPAWLAAADVVEAIELLFPFVARSPDPRTTQPRSRAGSRARSRAHQSPSAPAP
jgi:putative hydrolase of the HAD superfamily